MVLYSPTIGLGLHGSALGSQTIRPRAQLRCPNKDFNHCQDGSLCFLPVRMYREQLGRRARSVGTVGLLPELNGLSFETEESIVKDLT